MLYLISHMAAIMAIIILHVSHCATEPLLMELQHSNTFANIITAHDQTRTNDLFANVARGEAMSSRIQSKTSRALSMLGETAEWQ